MYLCARDIDFVFFCDFNIGFFYQSLIFDDFFFDQ